MSERTFRRWRERYEAEGAEGLYDRRLGWVSARRAPVDEVMRVLELFETRYPDFTAKHFHEKLVYEHGFGLSYNWLRLSLQAHGKIKPAPRRGAHRRKRPRRPVVGMMPHQDGSSHEWVAVRWPRKIGQVFKSLTEKGLSGISDLWFPCCGYAAKETEDVDWTLLTKVETSCDRILIAGGANVEAEWEQGPAV